jgi:hypothetical protein
MSRTWTPARLALLLALLALAEWLRATGLSFGLPAVYNPDEVAIMSRALGFAKGDLNPHNFLYPTFYFYVLFAWVGGWFVWSWLTGAIASLGAFQTQFFLDPSGVYLAGRSLGVACGVATVAVTWLLGQRVAGWRAGACAALFLAVAPTAVRDAHYVKHGVPVTLAIAVAMLVLARLARVGDAANAAVAPPSPAALAGAGAACGVAFSTHYYAIFLALPLALAIEIRLAAAGRHRLAVPGAMPHLSAGLLRGWAWAAAGAAVTFFALSPFLLVEPGTAWQDIVANRQIVVDRASGLGRGPLPSLGVYLRLLWQEGVGWPVLGAAVAGAILLTRRRPWQALLLLLFPVAFLLFISHTVAASRYLNPVLPLLAVLAGTGLTLASRSTPITAALAVMLALPAAWQSRQIGLFFSEADTRSIAQEWIEAHVPPGSTILVQPYSVVLTQSRDSLVEALTATLGDPSRASTKFAIRLGLEPYPEPAYRTIYLGDGGLDADKLYVSPRAFTGGPTSAGATGLEPLTRLGVQYVVLKRYNVEDPAAVPLRARLTAVATRVAVVSPYRTEASDADRARVAPFLHNTDTPWHPALQRPGPGLEIWKLPR